MICGVPDRVYDIVGRYKNRMKIQEERQCY